MSRTTPPKTPLQPSARARFVAPLRLLWRAVLGTSASLLLAVGCLPDLPEPLECPPAPQVEMGDCTAALVDAPDGCFERERMECLTGKRSTCGCIANECPGDDACYSDGDCPAPVSQLNSRARCRPLEEEDIGIGEIPAASQCVCGCYGCAAACDGYGPVIGANAPEGTVGPVMYVALDKDLPDRGRLGIYLRTRGFGSLYALVLRGTPQQPEYLGAYYFIPAPLSSEFANDVLFDNGLVVNMQTDGRAYRWETPDEKPTLLQLLPSLDAEAVTVSLLEIDCVVPFVVPLEEE